MADGTLNNGTNNNSVNAEWVAQQRAQTGYNKGQAEILQAARQAIGEVRSLTATYSGLGAGTFSGVIGVLETKNFELGVDLTALEDFLRDHSKVTSNLDATSAAALKSQPLNMT